MGKLPSGLSRRGNVYQIRRRVPDEIRSIIGKTEIIESLGTGDVGIARELHAARNAEIEKQFSKARRELHADKLLPLTIEQAKAYARQWFKNEYARGHKEASEAFGNAGLDDLVQNLDEEESYIKTASDPEIMPTLQQIASKILKEHGYSANVDTSGAGYWELVNLVRRGWLEENRRLLRFLQGEPVGTIDCRFENVTTDKEPSKDNIIVTLSALVEEFLCNDENRSERTKMDFRAAFRPMLEVLGPDTDIKSLMPEDFAKVKALIVRLPPNAFKANKNQAKTLTQISDENAGGQVLSKTV